MAQLFPVVVKVLKKTENGSKVETGEYKEGFAPKFVPADSGAMAREIVMAELIKADEYDAADPMLSVRSCNPLD